GLTSTPGESPADEMVDNALDGNPGTKYLNKTGPGSGYTLTLDRAEALDALALTTRTNDDIWQWDPKTWEVWGSNSGDPFASSAAWSKLGGGDTGLANGRGASNVVTFDNTASYLHYKVVFPTVKGSYQSKTYLHIAEAKLFARPPAAATGELAGQGFAFSLDATAKVPIPFINESLYGEVSVGANFTGAPVSRDVTVSGQTIEVSFDASGETRFELGNLDASLDGRIGDLLNTVAGRLSSVRADLINAAPLPVINRTLDQILNISPYLQLGDDVLDYLAKPADFYGVKGVPTVRGLQAYLAWANTDRAGPTVTSVIASSARSPISEGAESAVDGTAATKYLNYDEEGAGLVFTLSEASRVSALTLSTANDFPERDPIEIAVYGATSEAAPAWGADTGWTPIAEGLDTGLTLVRNASRTVSFDNTASYRHYKLVFSKVRDAARANSVQVGEVNLFPQQGLVFDFNEDGLKLGLKANVAARVDDLALDFGSRFDGLGLAINGDVVVDGSFTAGIDFDLGLDWSDGFKADFALNDLSFGGTLSAKDLVLQGTLGPLAVSIGRAGDAKPASGSTAAVPWARGSLDASFGGRMAWQKGELSITPLKGQDGKPLANRFELTLPMYASIAGIDLIASATQVPTLKLVGDPLAGGISIVTEHFDQLTNVSRMSMADLLRALSGVLSYLDGLSADQLGLNDLPVISQGVDELLDLAGLFQREVIDRIDLYRPMKLWQPATAQPMVAASGTARLTVSGQSTLAGEKGQFAKSMTGYWVTLSGASGGWLNPTQIVSVAEDGSSVVVRDVYVGSRAAVQYKVHERRETIRTIDEYVDAFNVAFKDSPVLGTITYDALTGDLRIPLRLRNQLVGLASDIDLGLGDADLLSLSTSAQGALSVDIDAGVDLVLALGGSGFHFASDRLRAQAALALSVTDLEVAAKFGFLGLKGGGAGTGSGVRVDGTIDFALDRNPASVTAGDTRFTLSQLLTSDAMDAVRFDIGGSAEARLRGLSLIGAQGASLSIAPDMQLALVVPDLGTIDGFSAVRATPTRVAAFDGSQPADTAQLSRLTLTGGFKAGDVIRIAGLSESELTLTVVAADLTEGNATATRAAIATRLATAVAATASARASAIAEGVTVRLTGKTTGAAGAMSLTATITRTNESTGAVAVTTDALNRGAATSAGLIGASDVVAVLPDLGSMLNLSQISFGDIVQGLRFALQTVSKTLEDQPFYSQTLPILD
ncbi:MAG: hypothetical protein ACKODG_15115, partial [Betaproteobacteria bacterium]